MVDRFILNFLDTIAKLTLFSSINAPEMDKYRKKPIRCTVAMFMKIQWFRRVFDQKLYEFP